MAKKKARADGRYQGQILIGVIDGKRKYKYVYGKSQKEVNDKLAVLRVELGQGADLTQPMSLAFWADRWLARTEQMQTPEWYDLCETRAEYWKQQLGKVSIDQITTADLEDVLLQLAKKNPKTGKPSSRKTLNEYRSVICRIFELAIRNRVMTFDASAYIQLPHGAPSRTRDAITDEEITRIRATPHECRLPSLIMIYAGLRWGEVAALTWSDVDLNKKQLSVNKSYNFKTHQLKDPKTAAGTRTVPIPDVLAEVLAQEPHTSLLVCTHKGQMWTNSSWKFAFGKYLEQLGIHTTAHCLRHTYATLLYEAGVDMLSAQYLMGHANSETTMDIYTHLRDRQRAASITKLNAFLSPATEKAEAK